MDDRHFGKIAHGVLCIIASLSLASCQPSKIDGSNAVEQSAEKDGGERVFSPKTEECTAVNGYILNGKVSPKAYSQWHIRLDKAGTLRWNGVVVSNEELRGYLSKIAGISSDSEFVSVEIEPQASCLAVEKLRRTVVKSGLCAHGRCTENVWDIKTPLVN